MKKYIFFRCFFLITFSVFSLSKTWSQIYPEIEKLHYADPTFKQFMQDVEFSYQKLARSENPEVCIYSYKTAKTDSLMRIAARCNLPYETIACINGISSINADISGMELLLPTAPGLFVKATPETGFELIVASKKFDISEEICYSIGGDDFYFLKGQRLSQTERAFFLDSSFASPLPHGVLTSKFGKRISPISGKEHFHGGIDLAAPSGTPVLAAKGGTVSSVGYNEIYGNYIVLRHLDAMESVYGHLLSADVLEGTVVNRGQVIGKVGSTGASTGPHLHFEIRANGRAQDVNNMFINK